MTNKAKKKQRGLYKASVIYALIGAFYFIASMVLDFTSLPVRTRQVIKLVSDSIFILFGVALCVLLVISKIHDRNEK